MENTFIEDTICSLNCEPRAMSLYMFVNVHQETKDTLLHINSFIFLFFVGIGNKPCCTFAYAHLSNLEVRIHLFKNSADQCMHVCAHYSERERGRERERERERGGGGGGGVVEKKRESFY